MLSKPVLRSELRRARRAVPPAERRSAGRALMRQALRHGLLLRHRRIGFYLPFDGEFDLLPLLDRALWLGKACYLPVVPPRFQKRLRFTRLNARAQRWYLNRFGIHEHWSPRAAPAWALDLLLVPLVGFDSDGNRLGMGGGFYDTTLAYLRGRRRFRRPRLIGIGFECQKVDALPRDPWDFPLEAVLTEKRYYRFDVKRAALPCPPLPQAGVGRGEGNGHGARPPGTTQSRHDR